MKRIEHPQGSPEWLAARARYFTASEAPAMMGASKNVTRNELLHIKATGTEREISDWVQKHLFDKGHEIEALARTIAEAIIGEELYPVTATDDEGWLLASFDGLTMAEDACWECKSWNEAKAAEVREGRCPEEDRWQVAQQLVVSGADRCLYMVSDGTEERTVHTWVKLRPDDSKRLVAGWNQFRQDWEQYVPPKVVPEAVGKTPEALPALRIEVTGMVTASNLDAFKEHALAVFAGINRELATDQDFADAEKTVKWCSDVESRLAAAKEHALSQTASIDELFRTVDDISAEARRVRLELDKLVKARKEEVRREIVAGSRQALDAHVAALNKRLGGEYLPPMQADFAGAIKSKRTIDSLRNAVDTTLAHAKIEANERADAIDANLKAAAELKADGLLPDLRTLVLKSPEDFRATVKLRIAERDERERKRQEAERERIRAEEQAKAQREAREAEERRQAELRAKEEAERRAQREAEESRLAKERQVEAEKRAAEQAKLAEERAELARQQAEIEEKRRAEAKRAAAERAEAERLERERRDAEQARLDSLQAAAGDLLAAAKLALVAVENPDDDEASREAAVALREAIALAEPEEGTA